LQVRSLASSLVEPAGIVARIGAFRRRDRANASSHFPESAAWPSNST
jgi:hypothetical protein